METEHLVNGHVSALRAGKPTAVGPALDAMLARWRVLPVSEAIHLEWSARHRPRVKHDAWQGRLTSRQRAATTFQR